MALQESWLKLVADIEIFISKGSTESGKVSTVGTKWNESNRSVGGAVIAVQQVGRVGAHISVSRVWDLKNE